MLEIDLSSLVLDEIATVLVILVLFIWLSLLIDLSLAVDCIDVDNFFSLLNLDAVNLSNCLQFCLIIFFLSITFSNFVYKSFKEL